MISTPPDNRKGLTPEFDVAMLSEPTEALAEPRRRLGFTDLLSAPSGSIATGQKALVSLSGSPRREAVVAAPVALHVHAAPPSEPAAGGGPATPAVPGSRRLTRSDSRPRPGPDGAAWVPREPAKTPIPES